VNDFNLSAALALTDHFLLKVDKRSYLSPNSEAAFAH